ncbi:MAG TPA: Na+/H+ antiporter, partial [Solirubrobacteraceae bacterium]|nr:Na+/H+ antiporter [Solirubrobacteraceae bacterium]
MGNDLEFLIGLLGAVALFAWLAQAAGLPYPIVLFAAGISLGYVPGLPAVHLDPDIIFLVFLPPLVHAAAYATSITTLRRDAGPISVLAIGGVAATVAAVAVVAHALVDGLSWEMAFVLGAAVAPTDTVAATSIFRRMGVPERVTSIVEGESLVNDGIALVLYRIAAAAATSGAFSLLDGAGELLLTGAGGAAVGLIVGYAIAWVRRRLDDPMIEITLTLVTPYLAYVPAEELHLSGILAAVTSGLYLGHLEPELFSPTTRLQARSFWAVLVFILESLLFILIGLQLPDVLDALQGVSAGDIALWSAAVSGAVIAVRLAVALAARGSPPVTRGERIAIGWSGMRGAVSLGAALAIPLTTDAGGALPGRDLVLVLTMAVIGVTLVLQGLTLPRLVGRLGICETVTSERRIAMARFRTVEAALMRIAELGRRDDGVPADVVERARTMYANRARQIAGLCRAGVPVDEEGNEDAWRRLRRELLEVERASLLQLRDQGEVT